MAPYWSDVDIRLAGNISYEVHSARKNNSGSDRLLEEISQFVEQSTGQSFSGTWMLVAEWTEVYPWPHGIIGGSFSDHVSELNIVVSQHVDASFLHKLYSLCRNDASTISAGSV